MEKDFDAWNGVKKKLQGVERTLYVHAREIWWCSVGLNIGAETDGKNDNFERPVIIMKVYNKETLIALPVTSKKKVDSFHYQIIVKDKIGWVKLTQTRVISIKRLSRKIDVLGEESFKGLQKTWKGLL